MAENVNNFRILLKNHFPLVTSLTLITFSIALVMTHAQEYPTSHPQRCYFIDLPFDMVSSILWGFRKSQSKLLFFSLASLVGTCTLLFAYCISLPSRKKVTSPELISNVSQAYDSWVKGSILENYWGEHIHLGYYNESEIAKPFSEVNLKKKFNSMVKKLLKFGNFGPYKYQFSNILDVGCGLGGTTRLLSMYFINAKTIHGISISEEQIAKAIQYNKCHTLATPCIFQKMDAQDMSFGNNSMDLVWICESSEHIYDKKKLFEEVERVLRPQGTAILAAWTKRDDSLKKITESEQKQLDYLHDQWCHAPFESTPTYKEIIESTGGLYVEKCENWTQYTLPTWHHTIYLGMRFPIHWMFKPREYMGLFKDTWCLHKMHNAFKSKLLEYSVFLIKKREKQLKTCHLTIS